MKNLLALAIALTTTLSFAKVYTYGIMGDGGYWNKNTKMIRESMSLRSINKLILPGDNLYDEVSEYEDVWKHWKNFKLDVVAIGNHRHSFEEEIAYFKMPGEYYSKVVDGNIRFIVLNSDNESTEKEQAEWFRKEIKKANEQFIIVVFHHPPYTIGKHTWKERREFHERIRPIMHANSDKIDLLLVGHDHVATLITLDKIPMIVSGASHEWHKPTHHDYLFDKRTHVRTRWNFKGGPHWTRLDIDTEDNHIWVNFVNAKKKEVVCSIRLKNKAIHKRANCYDKVQLKD